VHDLRPRAGPWVEPRNTIAADARASASATILPAEATTRTGTWSIADVHRSACDARRAPGPMCRQVFGLADVTAAPSPNPRRFPGCASQCLVAGFVSADRCGAAPESHRIPF